MKIEKVKITPYVKVGYCEKCGGRLKATGMVFLTYPAIYEYKCTECGNIEESKEKLDEIVYEEVPVS